MDIKDVVNHVFGNPRVIEYGHPLFSVFSNAISALEGLKYGYDIKPTTLSIYNSLIEKIDQNNTEVGRDALAKLQACYESEIKSLPPTPKANCRPAKGRTCQP